MLSFPEVNIAARESAAGWSWLGDKQLLYCVKLSIIIYILFKLETGQYIYDFGCKKHDLWHLVFNICYALKALCEVSLIMPYNHSHIYDSPISFKGLINPKNRNTIWTFRVMHMGNFIGN
jgi:hypothetical protein